MGKLHRVSAEDGLRGTGLTRFQAFSSHPGIFHGYRLRIHWAGRFIEHQW